MNNVITSEAFYGEYRIQGIGKGILRVERRFEGGFYDGETFNVKIKKEDAAFSFSKASASCTVLFDNYRIVISKNINLPIKIYKNKKLVYTYEKEVPTGELPSPHKTPEIFAILDAPRILLAKRGYFPSENQDEGFVTQKDAFDLYILFVHKDPVLLRKLVTKLTGPIAMPPLSVFGLWESRYYEYTDKTVRKMVNDFKRHDIPMDNFVIDTDWRIAANGTGYDVNKKDFPCIENTMQFLHENRLVVYFNDHPEPTLTNKIPNNVFASEEIKFRSDNLAAILRRGLDYWWYDRNWWTGIISPDKRFNRETLGLYLYDNVTEKVNEEKKGDSPYPERSWLMGNIDNVANGDYRGINNFSSHRYGTQWTGDISSSQDTLVEEFRNMIKCGNSLISNYSSDLPGHVGTPTPDLYIRWMQYAALSPTFRLHSTNSNRLYREPWLYGKKALNETRKLVKMRYRLLPYFYSYAYQAYRDGISLIRSPEYYDKTKKCQERSFAFLGQHIAYVVPLDPPSTTELNKDAYASKVHAVFYDGRDLKGSPIDEMDIDELAIDFGVNSPSKKLPEINFSARFEFDLLLNEKSNLIVASDDGIRVFIDGRKTFDNWECHALVNQQVGSLEADTKHHIMIEYFQGEGGAGIYAKKAVYPDHPFKFYVPMGWYTDAYTGKRIKGGSLRKFTPPINRFPMLIKDGAIIPLAKEVNNSNDSDWSSLSINIFPGEGTFTLYEDDRHTTAFKDGHFRTTLIEQKIGEVVIHPIKGKFDELTVRHILFRVRGKYSEIILNNEKIPCKIRLKDKNADVLSFDGSAKDGDITEAIFDIDISKTNVIQYK
ncbi:MAG: DUF5110 domain-containing protein [Bacilli bacterium]|nr:DUF5110 domain-containing protein [Bacilli bacterium]